VREQKVKVTGLSKFLELIFSPPFHCCFMASSDLRVMNLSAEQAATIWQRISEYTTQVSRYSDGDASKNCVVWTGATSVSEVGYPITTVRKGDVPDNLQGSYLVHLLKLRAEGKPLPDKGITHYSHTCHNKRCFRHYTIEPVVKNRARIGCPKEVPCPCSKCSSDAEKEKINMCAILHPNTSPCIFPSDFWKDKKLWTEAEERQLIKPKNGRPKKQKLFH